MRFGSCDQDYDKDYYECTTILEINLWLIPIQGMA